MLTMMLPEPSVSQVSVMKAMLTPSKAWSMLSVLLQIERTFHKTQGIEFTIVRLWASFFLYNKGCCL